MHANVGMYNDQGITATLDNVKFLLYNFLLFNFLILFYPYMHYNKQT